MRTAEKQPEVLPLSSGMNQSFGQRGAPPGTLDLVKNCRVRSGGLMKRCGSSAIASTLTTGYRAISDTTSISRPIERPAFIRRLGSDQRIAATTAGHVFSFDSSGNSRFSGEISAAQPVRKRFGIAPGIAAAAVGPYMPSVAVNPTGYIVTAAGFGTELRITVESPTGELLLTYTDAAAAAANLVVRVVAISSANFYVCYQDIASTTVKQILIQTANGGATYSTAATLVTLANASSTWDVSYYDGTTWFLVYQSGATTVTISERDTSGTQVTSQTFSSTDNRTYLSIWADAVTDRVWIGLVDDPTGTPLSRFRVYTDALVLSVGPTSFSGTGGVPLFGPLYKRTPVAGDAFCVFADSTAVPTTAVTVGAVIQAGSLTREVTVAVNAIPISKPDVQQRVWCMTHGDGSNFLIQKAVLLRFVGDEYIGESSNDPSPVVELATPDFEAPGSTYHQFAQPGLAFNAVAVTSESDGGRAYFAVPVVVTSRTNASGTKEPTGRVETYEYTRHNQEPHKQVTAIGRTGFAAGQPTELWGLLQLLTSTRVEHGGAEIGFAHSPTIITSTTSPSAGALDAGSFVYYAVHQWVDDEGNRHLSAPSAPYTVTLTVPSSVTLRVTNCLLGQRPDRSQSLGARALPPLIYRTQNAGTEAQLVPIAPSGPGGGWVAYQTYTDNVPDSIIDDNEFLYTAGGVLPNVLAPSCRYIAGSEERLWCGGLWEANIIECSKIRVPGEPYCFTGHPSHQVVIPGEVSGLAYMDGQVAAFTEDAIYLVAGDGPNDQGAGGFAPPRALVRGVGCPRTLSASILETELGILFRSAMGFYLIPRGFGTPQYIGEPVHEEDDVVLSAATTTTENYRLARFLVCASGETKADTVLALDLTTMQWFRDEYQVNGSITGQGFSEIGEWPDGLALFSYGLQRTDNLKVIWSESESLTGDAGADGAGATTYISQYARTAWVYPWGPAGLGQLSEILFTCEAIGSSSVVTVTVETDGNTAQSPFWTITTSEAVSYRAVGVAQPLCTAFRVTVSDAAGAANSAGVRLLFLGFETKSPGGMRRVTDGERQ